MDHTNDLIQTLAIFPGPAFAAKNGIVTHCNPAAEQLIAPGTDVKQLLSGVSDDYSPTSEGSLSVALTINDVRWGASVMPMTGYQLFRLEPIGMTPELKAMSLLSSQLRHPLTSLSLLTDNSPSPDINRELAKILRILNNVSNAERFATSVPQMRTQDVCAVMKELLQECAELLAEAQIILRYSVPEKTVYTDMDWQMVRHAVYALVDNAAMQTATGGVIVAEFTADESRARLSITDHGSGIPESVMGSLFSRYTRQAGIEDGLRNLGLGMTLVRSAAFTHGGTVLVEKLGTKGTRVSMTMKICQSDYKALRSPLVSIVNSADDAKIMLSNVLPAKLYNE